MGGKEGRVLVGMTRVWGGEGRVLVGMTSVWGGKRAEDGARLDDNESIERGRQEGDRRQ